MDDIQKIETNQGEIAQNVYGDQIAYIYNFNDSLENVRDDYLKNFATIIAMWNIEVDYHYRLLFFYSSNINSFFSFTDAIYQFNDIFPEKIKEYQIDQKTAKKRIREMHKKVKFTDKHKEFLQMQTHDNFKAFFVDLPQDNWKKEDVIIYGICAIVYYYILSNKKSDKFILDICYHSLSVLRASDYKNLDYQFILDTAMKEQAKSFISV